MNFNSWQFLIYLPVVIVVYFLLPKKVKWIWLLIASYFFYMCWNVWLSFQIFGVTLCTYLFALGIGKTDKKWLKKLYLILTLALCLGLLIYFKYFNFLYNSVTSLLRLFGMNASDSTLDILLPVGISFYTFQSLSYVLDVYWEKFHAEKHFGYYALFVSYFPQLVAGPIEKVEDLMPQLKEPKKFNMDDFSAGMRLLLVGFFRKCVVADLCGIYVNNVFNNLSSQSGFSVLLGGALFCFQMYGDFAGYSEIAMGSARIMGVKLTQNFDQPYLSQSYTEFFHRWHYSLNRWFTEYLYIPLGGSKKGKGRKILNTFIVFGLCGLWHGANWTYLLWGIYAAIFVSIESLLRKPFLSFAEKKNINLEDPYIKLARRCIMFLFFIPAAILFRANNVGDALTSFRLLFTSWGGTYGYFVSSFEGMGFTAVSFFLVILSILIMHVLYSYEYEWKKDNWGSILSTSKREGSLRMFIAASLILVIAFAWIKLLGSGDASSFAYFQF